MTKHSPEIREHMIHVKVSRSEFGRAYFASQRAGISLSEMVRRCMTEYIDKVEKEVTLEKYKKG